jgi:hypothetical protein
MIRDNKHTEAAKFDVGSYRNKLVSNIKADGVIDLGEENSISFY